MAREEGRYEPLPPITGLPAFMWRRLPPGGRIAVVALGVAAIAATAVAVPTIRDSRRDADARAEREEAAHQKLRLARLRALVKPRGMSAPGPAARVLSRLRLGIAEDAGRRTGDRIIRTSCERVPAAESRPAAPRPSGMRLRCLAVTADIPKGASSVGGSIGYPYRAVADIRRGRVTFCRVFGVPGEGGLTSRRLVTVPRSCGG